MPTEPNGKICMAHSGMCKAVKDLEEDVRELWSKYNGMQKLLIGTLVSSLFTLMGMIGTLVTLYLRAKP